jgi:outer membrane protein assembly factor BamB
MRGSVLVAVVTAAVAAMAGPALAGGARPWVGARPGVAAPGARLWVSRFPARGSSEPADTEVVSPDGATVFVTAASSGGRPRRNVFQTVAYSARTGRQRWASRYHGPGILHDQPSAIAMSQDGRTVFVTGSSHGRGDFEASDYATVACNAASGKQLWASRYHGPGQGARYPISVEVSPGGHAVYVTGEAFSDYATVAYNAATGRQLWASRYKNAFATSMVVSPDGRAVFVTGYRTDRSFATVAYNAATGKQLWARRYHGYGGPFIAVSPKGTTVYVTGGSKIAAYVTIAYNAATGRPQWTRLYHGPANKGGACGVAVSPRGDAVFVTGSTQVAGRAVDYTTIAYRG